MLNAHVAVDKWEGKRMAEIIFYIPLSSLKQQTLFSQIVLLV